MTERSLLPPAAVIGALATTLAVLFAGAVIWFTRILPAINDRPVQVSTTTPASPVPAAEAARWSGVARLTGSAQCTGVLLNTGGDSAPAYLLTAGHCGPALTLDANAVVVNRAAAAGTTATFGVIDGVSQVAVPVDRVMYSSMKGTDVSVLRLDATLGDLRDRGVGAYDLVPVDPPSGADVTNVAVPAQGLGEADIVLREGSCTLGPDADLVEDGWRFDRMFSTDCPGVIGGSSGSPLFDADDRVSGMITTTTAGSLPGGACALDTPCERTATGVRVVPDTSYAVATAALARCFVNATFGLADSCPLPRPGLTLRLRQTVFSSAGLTARGATVDVSVVADRSVSVDVGIAPVTDRQSCTDPATYTETARAQPSGGTARVALPTAEGFFLVCVAVPGQLASAAQAVFQVDDTPPVRTPSVSLTRLDGELSIEPVFSAPELSRYRYKIGPEGSTDCADPTGYQSYESGAIGIRAGALPVTVCLIGLDQAGNAGAPWSEQLPS